MPSLSSIRGYALPVGLQVAGGLLNRRASGNAARTLTQGAQTGIDTVNAGFNSSRKSLADAYKTQQGLLDPYRSAGMPALNTLQAGTAPGGDFVKPFDNETFDLYKDPSFNYRLQQGERGLRQEANASGTRFSGATLKALSDYNQNEASKEWAAARGRSVEDTTNAYNRTRDMANFGYDAAGREVDAAGAYGTNVARTDQVQAQQVADLQTELASAQALGDVGKANAITRMLNGIDAVGTAKSLATMAAKGVGLGSAGISAAGLAGTHAAGITGVGALGTAAAPLGGGGFGAATGATAGTAASGSGLGATVGGLLTNPITIAAGAAIGIGLLWHKSQAHETANQWVSTQNDFDNNMAAINENPQLNPANKAELQKANLVDYLASALSFAQKHGGKGAEVIGNAMRTFREWYPQYAGMAVA